MKLLTQMQSFKALKKHLTIPKIHWPKNHWLKNHYTFNRSCSTHYSRAGIKVLTFLIINHSVLKAFEQKKHFLIDAV